jgi:methionyl-tRNA formyltransferase
MDGNHIIALINASNPWNKGASTMINNKVIRFLDAENYSEHSIQSESAAGTVLRLDKTGMIVSTINNEVICVRIVHTDEGFLMAGRLQELGVQTGQHFEMLHQ